MSTNKYVKIFCLLCCMAGFHGIVLAQDLQQFKQSIKSDVDRMGAESDAAKANAIKKIEREIQATVERLNQQYQSKTANSKTVYVMKVGSTYLGTAEAVFPDLASCQREMAMLKQKIGSYKVSYSQYGGTTSYEYIPKQYLDKVVVYTTKNNPNYNPDNQNNKGNDPTSNLQTSDNFGIEDNTSQMQTSIFAVTGARERKEEQPASANTKAPEVDLSNLDKYLKPAVEEKREISAADIEAIIEDCIVSSDFCRCIQSKFTALTGRNLSGKNSQIRSEADIETNRQFNEYLGKIHNGIDAYADKKKRALDEDYEKYNKNKQEKTISNKEINDLLERTSLVIDVLELIPKVGDRVGVVRSIGDNMGGKTKCTKGGMGKGRIIM